MKSTLFEIMGIPIRSYGMMMVIGFALGLWRAIRVGRRVGFAPERIYDLSLVVLLSGVVGARLVFVLLNPDTENWARFYAVWNGGLSFHGGVLLAVVGGYCYTRFTGLGFWQCADLFAPSIAIGYAVTRVGCFLNGCCYGAPTNLPWAVRFVENGVCTPPSHPTQIYATLANLIIYLILTRLESWQRNPGFIFTSYLMLYGVYRFAVEFLRKGYSAKLLWAGLTQAQVISLAMIGLCGLVLLVKYRRPRKP